MLIRNVSVAIAMHSLGEISELEVPIKVLGGKLIISFKPNTNGSYSDIWLTGPTTTVFTGEIELPA